LIYEGYTFIFPAHFYCDYPKNRGMAGVVGEEQGKVLNCSFNDTINAVVTI
jgi:hypothetical protein